jgi:hypothetical protein
VDVRPRRRALAVWMLLATAGAYALFFYHGVAYGARFYYETFPFAALLVAAAIVDLDRWLDRPRWRGARAALAGMWPALLLTGMIAAWPAVEQHAGRRNRTQDGRQLEVLARPELADAVVFVDSMIIPAAATAHPARLDENRPLVVKDLGDASNAGYMRRWPDRRPVRLAGTRVVPLDYPRDAPIRHEGGALYPLEIAEGGFGDRVSIEGAYRLPLSFREALRFRAGAPDARFAFPTWLPADAASLRLVVVAHRAGPEVQVSVDGAPISGWLSTHDATPRLATFDLPATVAAGRHWIEIRVRAPGVFLMDYLELREDILGP